MQVADLRSPRDFPLSSGTLLYASYAYSPKSDSETCHVDSAVRQRIQQEESIGEQEHHRSFLSRNWRRTGSPKHQSNRASSESSESSEYQTQGQIQSKKHQQIRLLKSENQLCVAEERLDVCPKGYKAVGGQPRPVKFLCFHKNSNVAAEAEQQVKKGHFVELDQHRYKNNGERQIFTVYQNPTKCIRSH